MRSAADAVADLDPAGRAAILGYLRLAVSALFLAGVFVLLVSSARTPLVALIAGRDYLYDALVAHVTFALTIWLLSFVALLWSFEAAVLARPLAHARVSLGLGWIGLVAIAAVALAGLGQPVMADYLPILLHPFYYLGLAAFGAGVGVAAFDYLAALRRSAVPPGLRARALAVSAIGYLAALGAFGVTLARRGIADYATLVWVMGHLLQLVDGAALIAAALLLAPTPGARGRALIERSLWVFAVPIGAAALVVVGVVPWEQIGAIFWGGLGLPLIVAWIVLAATCVREIARGRLRLGEVQFLVVALVLFGTGGVIPLFGLGNDTRVTAHYHGVVGAVTIVFMGLTYRFLAGFQVRPAWRRATRLEPYLYGGGLLAVIVGLFGAGEAGTTRKIFESIASNPSLIVAATLFALGALVTIAGGVVFVVGTGAALLRASAEPSPLAPARDERAGAEPALVRS